MVNPQIEPKTPRLDLPSPAVLQNVPVSEDVIEYTIACALALSPPEIRSELRAHIAMHTSKQARSIFGGDRVYIGLRPGGISSQRNAAIRRDHANGERIALLERRYGLSRARIWQVINS